jgi:4-amino-4-deoxy-L-arabinose transferase-like glycosyltransferase
VSPTASRRAALIISLVAFSLVLLAVRFTGAARGGFRIDEAHKISETPFLSLWINGRWHDPAWFADLVDRTNPPVGKYAFALAIRGAGLPLPQLPTLGARSVEHYVPPIHPPELSEPYRRYLPAVRPVSTLATALFAAVIAWCSARNKRAATALVATTLLLTNYLTQLFWATAVFDPLLTLFAALLLPATIAVARRGKWSIAGWCGVGLAGALAFQTRLSGIVFFLATIALVSIYTVIRGRLRELPGGVAAAGLVFLFAVLLLNPYYWSRPEPGGAAVAAFDAPRGPLTPVARLRGQLHDAQLLMATPAVKAAELRTVASRWRFMMEIVFGDVAGLLLFFGSALGTIELALRWRSHSDPYRLAALWCVTTTTVFVWLLPLAWPRYLLVIVPPLSYLAGNGYSAVVDVWRSRRNVR